ncbi:MAG: pseudouridine synthase, partial [Caldithrix sp.]
MIRLNKYLADCGVGSRRKCDQFILEGKVSVNGSIESRLGVKIDENTDSVKFADNLLKKVN